jgi:general bacterial porin, GBP family
LTGSDGGTYFAHPFDNDNANATYLVDSSIKWESPTWHGFHFGGQYAVSPTTPGPHAWSVGAAFGHGPLSVAASYAQSGAIPLDEALGAAVVGALTQAKGSVAPSHVLAQRIYGAGINYELGDATLGAAWTHARYQGHADDGAGMPGAAFTGRVDFDNYEINARYRATGAWSFAAAYTFTQGRAHSGTQGLKTSWNQFGLIANYAMSKRTDLFVEGIHQRTTEGEPLAFVNGVDLAGSDQQSVLSMGMRHRF